jgi:hypothetical protein
MRRFITYDRVAKKMQNTLTKRLYHQDTFIFVVHFKMTTLWLLYVIYLLLIIRFFLAFYYNVNKVACTFVLKLPIDFT